MSATGRAFLRPLEDLRRVGERLAEALALITSARPLALTGNTYHFCITICKFVISFIILSDRICEVKTMAEERHLMMIRWSGE